MLQNKNKKYLSVYLYESLSLPLVLLICAKMNYPGVDYYPGWINSTSHDNSPLQLIFTTVTYSNTQPLIELPGGDKNVPTFD